MPLLGEAAIAMWWNVAGEHLAEFQEWHSKEHLPERLALPGFRRGSRWRREGTGDFFVIYELAEYAALVSPAYRQRLDNPTPWSTAMMPLHRGMVRSQCRVVASHGRGVATFCSTIRLSPPSGRAPQLAARLGEVLAEMPNTQGITAAHLLVTDTPASPPTREQQIRAGDAAADWIVLVAGHDPAALQAAFRSVLGPTALGNLGAADVSHDQLYRLVHAMAPQDL